MEIYLGMTYSPNAFIDIKTRHGVFFDSEVVGVDGFVRILELYYGLHYDDISESDREAAYYKAMNGVMAKSENILTASWNTNSLGVSNACLRWRDALVSVGWNAEMTCPSERLEVLAQVENDFHCPALADRLQQIIKMSKESNPLPDGSTIHVGAYSADQVSPQMADLLHNLEVKGTSVIYEQSSPVASNATNLHLVQQTLLHSGKADKNRLNLCKNDDSLEILEFETEMDALRYILTRDSDMFDLYINNDSKLMDNVQRMLGQPTSGSSMNAANPQIVQLFRLGLNLFEPPMNIRNLISWLLLPLHPLKAKLRYKLVRAILSTGGYQNEEYNKVISDYLESIENAKERQRAEESIRLYIPSPDENGTRKETLLGFVSSLGTWCSQMARLDDMADIRRMQLAKVSGLFASLYSIIESSAKDSIPFSELECWASALYSSSDFPLYECQSGSRWVCGTTDIADDVNDCIWMDCYNYIPQEQPTAFLNDSEREALGKSGCRFWDVNDYNKSSFIEQIRPLLKSRYKLVIVNVKTCKGNPTTKHPLMLMLEQMFGDDIKAIVKQPKVERKKEHKIKPVENYEDSGELQINHTDLIAFPQNESYTSLDNIIQYPLDYMLDRVVHFHERSSTELDEVRTAKGNVAHAVIERLFKGNAEDIRKALTNRYENVLQETIKERGGILLLRENIIELRMFRNNLLENLRSLLNIIKANNLTTISQEKHLNGNIGLLEGDADPEINSYIDMVLQTEAGGLVVFDFKWTSSKSWHKNLLEKNASVQLALYKYMIELTMKQSVEATAYFTMPRHQMFTTSERLKGDDVVLVQPTDISPLLPTIINSYRFRRQQLESGLIEFDDCMVIDSTPYGEKTGELNLVPLESDYNDDTIHAANPYSNYNCFKGGLK